MPVSTECAAALLSFRYPSYQLKEMKSSKRSMWKGYYLSIKKRYTKGVPFSVINGI